jgi:hypothetical protein
MFRKMYRRAWLRFRELNVSLITLGLSGVFTSTMGGVPTIRHDQLFQKTAIFIIYDTLAEVSHVRDLIEIHH